MHGQHIGISVSLWLQSEAHLSLQMRLRALALKKVREVSVEPFTAKITFQVHIPLHAAPGCRVGVARYQLKGGSENECCAQQDRALDYVLAFE